MKTYTLDEIAKILKWHKAAIKASLSKMGVDIKKPISEQDAQALAIRMRKTWPSSDS